LVGPHVLPRRLTGPQLFGKRLGPTAWRGSTYHTSTCGSCMMTHQRRWIGRAGPVACPPHSPNLNPLDFYLCRHLKTLVYSNLIPDVDTLRQRVKQGCASIRHINGLCKRIRRSLMRRAQLYVAAGGRHFEHLLWCERPSCTITAIPC
jgi:hypothetical protein